MAKKGREMQAPAAVEAGPGLALTLLVVVSGAALMAFEIAGSRMLAPYFGNSAFVWGSLIGVVLTSLALGAWAGGLLVDRRPSFPLLCGLTGAAAVLVLASRPLVPPVSHLILEAGAGDRAGPLIAAAAVFFLPSVLLGMVSPFALRLSVVSLGSLGGHTGRLSALGTGGSIVGTLGTTFGLLPYFDVGTIVLVVGGALVVVPVVALALHRRVSTAAFLAVLTLGAGAWAKQVPTFELARGEKLVFEGSSPYHQLAVVDANEKVRYLKFDRFYESGVELAPPQASVFAYTYGFHLGPMLRPAPERVLFLGAGGGSGPRDFLATYPSLTRIDVVDVDPLVLQVAEQHFGLERSQTMRLHAEDARRYLRRTEEGPWDVILLDVFTIGGRIPFHLATREFLQELRARLTPGGVLVMNVNASMEGGKAEILAALHATVREAFGASLAVPVVYPHERDEGTQNFRERSRNLLLVAVNGATPTPSALRGIAAAASHDAARTFGGRVMDLVQVGPVLTDGWAPIETMAF